LEDKNTAGWDGCGKNKVEPPAQVHGCLSREVPVKKAIDYKIIWIT